MEQLRTRRTRRPASHSLSASMGARIVVQESDGVGGRGGEPPVDVEVGEVRPPGPVRVRARYLLGEANSEPALSDTSAAREPIQQVFLQ